MNAIETLLDQPIFQALGWTLIHFIWQGALIAVLYLSVSVLLRRCACSGRSSYVNDLICHHFPIVGFVVPRMEANRGARRDLAPARNLMSRALLMTKREPRGEVDAAAFTAHRQPCLQGFQEGNAVILVCCGGAMPSKIMKPCIARPFES